MHMNPSEFVMPPEMFEGENPLAELIEFKTFFAAQVWWAQLLILLGLIAITVAAFAIVYYIIKGIFYLIIEAVKLVVAIFKSIFKPSLTTNQSYNTTTVTSAPAPMQQYVVTAPVQTTMQISTPMMRTTMESRPVVTSMPATKTNLFCPMCGEAFTEQMVNLAKSQSRVFCEYCGNGVEVPK